MMKNNKKTRLNENALRSLLRKEIVKILEADKESEEAPQEKPKEEPKEEEPGLPADLEAATNLYIRKLRDNASGIEDGDLVEMVSSIVSAFTSSSEHRLSVLKAVKANIVR
jgi:hypothetical protein